MSGHSQKLNAVKPTLRRGRALFFLMLRTFAWTAISLGGGIYYLNESLRPAPAKAAVKTAVPARRTVRQLPLKTPPPAPPAAERGITDPLSLIKPSRSGPAATRTRTSPAAPPRLKAVTFGGSGGNFVPLGQEEQERAPGLTESAPRDQEAVLLPDAALSKKVKVKGARPVPAAAGKKYSGVDPEAEFLRERVRRQAAAAETYRIRLRNEKLLIAGWVILLVLAVMLISSRVVKAWRAIHKPEGSHWTLK